MILDLKITLYRPKYAVADTLALYPYVTAELLLY